MFNLSPDHISFNKIARLSKQTIITEKIDGTNGVIYIDSDNFLVGSRNRWLDEHNENYGFYKWAQENKKELMKLGSGWHYGEWWGNGIQRGYAKKKGDRVFSLFNVKNWKRGVDKYYPFETAQECPACCEVVPILKVLDIFDTSDIENELSYLKMFGSSASPGFMDPEGVVIYHTASKTYFKKFIKDDFTAKEDK